MPIAVSDPDDPRIEAYRAIRERDLVGRAPSLHRGRRSGFAGALQQSRFRIELLLLAEGRLEGLERYVTPSFLRTSRSTRRTARSWTPSWAFRSTGESLPSLSGPPCRRSKSFLAGCRRTRLWSVSSAWPIMTMSAGSSVMRRPSAPEASCSIRRLRSAVPQGHPCFRRRGAGGAFYAGAIASMPMVRGPAWASFDVIALSPSGREILSQVGPAPGVRVCSSERRGPGCRRTAGSHANRFHSHERWLRLAERRDHQRDRLASPHETPTWPPRSPTCEN